MSSFPHFSPFFSVPTKSSSSLLCKIMNRFMLDLIVTKVGTPHQAGKTIHTVYFVVVGLDMFAAQLKSQSIIEPSDKSNSPYASFLLLISKMIGTACHMWAVCLFAFRDMHSLTGDHLKISPDETVRAHGSALLGFRRWLPRICLQRSDLIWRRKRTLDFVAIGYCVTIAVGHPGVERPQSNLQRLRPLGVRFLQGTGCLLTSQIKSTISVKNYTFLHPHW